MPAKIVLLDDDDDLRATVAEIFDLLGNKCLAFPSVAAMKEAHEEVLACRLAILDVNLGQGLPSGVDAYRWLREQHFCGTIVFLTGHGPLHPLVASAAALGVQILNKPLPAAELRALAGEHR
jgi:DNA-binding response OmpR family regulator